MGVSPVWLRKAYLHATQARAPCARRHEQDAHATRLATLYQIGHHIVRYTFSLHQRMRPKQQSRAFGSSRAGHDKLEEAALFEPERKPSLLPLLRSYL